MKASSEPARRLLIVNADDYGMSDGVNRGVLEAFDNGIVTSASLMVTMPAAASAVEEAHSRPGLSLGIHVDLTGEGTPAPVGLHDVEDCAAEIDRQLRRFEELVGSRPSHIDAHHNIFRLGHLEPLFVRAARQLDRPLREHSAVRYFPDFYGQWDDGASHPEWISSANLVRMLDHDIGSGVTELSCHPGYVDPALSSSYHAEREIELKALCDLSVIAHISRSDLQLISYAHVATSDREVP